MDIDTKEQFSNIVTPPDLVNTVAHTVVIIDPEVSEIEDLAFYLKTSPNIYTVYLYRSDMGNNEWLSEVSNISTSIIVNTVQNGQSGFKDKLAVHKKSWYYGPKNFLMNNQRLEKPIDYFVQQDQPK